MTRKPILHEEQFNCAQDLVEFVNRNNIKQSSIQSIHVSFVWTLFYWTEEG